MKEDRVRLPRVRAPQQDDVRILDFTIRTGATARSEYRRQTGDARRVSSAVAAIDMITADHRPHELLSGIVQLVRRFGTTEHAERISAVFRELGLKTLRHAVQRLIQACRTMAAIFANQRTGQPFSQ